MKDIIHLFHTFLGDGQNYQPQDAVDHLMNYEYGLKMDSKGLRQ